jgi:hypothetical protein
MNPTLLTRYLRSSKTGRAIQFLNLRENSTQGINNTIKLDNSQNHTNNNIITVGDEDAQSHGELNKPNEFYSNRHKDYRSGSKKHIRISNLSNNENGGVEYESNGTVVNKLIENVFGNISKNFETGNRESINEYNNTAKDEDNLSISSVEENLTHRRVLTHAHPELRLENHISISGSYRSLMSQRKK